MKTPIYKKAMHREKYCPVASPYIFNQALEWNVWSTFHALK